jgi:heavy metal translocating P-type ATPase
MEKFDTQIALPTVPVPDAPLPTRGRIREFVQAVPIAQIALVTIGLVGLILGLGFARFGQMPVASWLWGLATLPVLIVLLFEIAVSLPRGKIGLDMLAAISMSSAIVLGEPLAGNVVALMYAGGRLLESYAEGQARREMTALLGRVAKTAMRYDGRTLKEVSIDALEVGDRLLIRHGEVIPVDGTVATGPASLDESALTGESLPMARAVGDEVMSGSTLLGAAFDLTVLRPAAASTYAGIVRLVEGAQQSKAPMSRLADRYALGFLVLSLGLAAFAWLISGEAHRALAVLVIATPCPLILAVPVAIISGISNAARRGVLVKDGGTMERLAQVRTAVLDKTGTLTYGVARVTDILVAPGLEPDSLLRLAASLDQASGHVVAHALIAEAKHRALALSVPSEVAETAGDGIEGIVDGKRIVVGGSSYVRAHCSSGDPTSFHDGVTSNTLTVAVGIDGVVSGIIVLADEVRLDAARVLEQMRAAGVERIVLASGDRRDVAYAIGDKLGVDQIFAELSPESKLDAITAERKKAVVMMVGDGVNDAPALALADVGVAMGARGAAASSEAASVVVLVDRLEPLAHAIEIAKRTRKIALESVFIGLGLSIGGMLVATAGYIEPVWGALFQEVIDVAVVVNALRALR